MDVFEAIDTRISVSVLRDPGPTDRQWEILLRAGARAPDHGRLRPWRFFIVRGEARELLGRVMAEALRASKPDTPSEALDRERRKPLRAPDCLSWPSSLFRIPACPKSSKFWRAAPRRRIFCSPPMPLALARFGARARRPITTMSRERSACPRRGASSPSSILARLMLRLYEASPPSRQAPWTGGRPRENSPCRRAGDRE